MRAPATPAPAAASGGAPVTPGASESPRDPGAADAYERGRSTAAPGAADRRGGGELPAGDPALASDVRREMHARQLRGPAVMQEARTSGTSRTGGTSGTPTADQQAFLDGMAARGVTASHPPTEAQLTQYFGTFNNRRDRPQALDAYQQYSSAYHVHIANTGSGSNDVAYSAESRYAVNGRFFDTQAEAERYGTRVGASEWIRVDTADASSWSDVTTSRARDGGRYVNDCEGFAYTSQRLLGAAGYRVEQVATSDPLGGNAHAMTVLRDPSSGRTAVTSNGDVFQGGTRAQLLDRAYVAAGGNSGQTYYSGATQAEAQGRLTLALDAAAQR